MLVEILRPAGAELARRWIACLMLAPEAEREVIVRSVEQRMAELYLSNETQSERTVNVEHPPEQREGFVEQKISTYAVKDEPD
ncbi:MAG: hypothetical protein HRU13_09785 [Phycisphaerales bacterium]|nr:hypothetical protein [Phycisphaerales bacterium]